ncbi:hypothetical protein BGZ47_008212 [Haplosporangium gracile]|nr:hypothetical protein BGZ47_008212 [Haplosporangium gracile]
MVPRLPFLPPRQDDDDILDGDDEDEEDEEEDDTQLHLLLHDEEGYLSDLSTISNENENENEGTITMTANGSTLRENTNRESAVSRRLMRRAISLEDLNTVSAIHHNHHHILDQDSLPERPSSSASMSLPVPSDTLPSLQPNDQTLYHRYYHHRSLERPFNCNTLLSDDNQYSLYRLDRDHQGPARTISPDADMDDLALLDDVRSTRSTYSTNPVLQDAVKDTTVTAPGGSLGWLNASPLLEALVSWVEGPPNRPQPKKNPNEKPNPILEIPFQFIALLTYPEPDPKTGDKMSLAMVRETAFVRQRRKTLMMLTAYTLIVRYCSFDFFLVVLFASNCGMLFLMKNSGRMNVNMAKRAVGQRVGWAKQWAGGFFKRGNGGATHNNNNNNTNSYIGNDNMSIHQGITTSNASSSKSLPNISSMPAESTRGVGMTASIIAGEKTDSAQENSPQIKRRGLFGKRKAYTTSLAPSQRIGASTSSILSPTSAAGEGLNGDDVSVMTGRTKRGFFKRNTNSSSNRSATAPPLDQPTTSTMPKHSTHCSTSTTATATILTSKNENPLLSTSPQPQNQSLSQLDWMFPARSPSPNVDKLDIGFFVGRGSDDRDIDSCGCFFRDTAITVTDGSDRRRGCSDNQLVVSIFGIFFAQLLFTKICLCYQPSDDDGYCEYNDGNDNDNDGVHRTIFSFRNQPKVAPVQFYIHFGPETTTTAELCDLTCGTNIPVVDCYRQYANNVGGGDADLAETDQGCRTTNKLLDRIVGYFQAA